MHGRIRHLIIAAAVLAVTASPLCRLSGQSRSIDLQYDRDGDSLSLWALFGPPAPHDYIVFGRDTLRFDFNAAMRGAPLSERDYEDVASRLGVETASIKAIVEIETGRTHRGFNADLTPIVSFSLPVFRTMARRNKINLAPFTATHSLVFEKADIRRYGSQQAVEHARMRRAMDIDTVSAIQATFWGMFQIGGFNWKRCGADSPEDFAERMSRSERDQLDLFAEFLRNSGLLPYLKSKNWTRFARGYNGPSYAANSYHTRLERAYKKFAVNRR